MIAAEAARLGAAYSDPNRAKNFSREHFHVVKVVNLSETVSVALYYKKPSEQFALMRLQFINRGSRDLHPNAQGVGRGSFIQHSWIRYEDCRAYARFETFLNAVESHNSKPKQTNGNF